MLLEEATLDNHKTPNLTFCLSHNDESESMNRWQFFLLLTMNNSLKLTPIKRLRLFW